MYVDMYKTERMGNGNMVAVHMRQGDTWEFAGVVSP